MNKKIVLVTALLIKFVVAVFGMELYERMNERQWLRDYFNEVIYKKDRNILSEYQPVLKNEPFFYSFSYEDDRPWFSRPELIRDCIDCYKMDEGEYNYTIVVYYMTLFNCKVKEIEPDLYELEIEDVRISQDWYEYFLENGHDMKFALDATEPEYTLYFRFDGDYLYIYLEDGKTLYATYCAYDYSEVQALLDSIYTNEFDMSKFTFPRHADGTCDYKTIGGVQGEKLVGGLYQTYDDFQLMEKGDINSEVIATIKSGSGVRILSFGKEETIDGVTNKWVQVELFPDAETVEGRWMAYKTGWCFGSCLESNEMKNKMKNKISILFFLMLYARLSFLIECFVRKALRMYDWRWSDYKIYPVTEDYTIVLELIPGKRGRPSWCELRVVTGDVVLGKERVESAGSREYRYLGKTGDTDVYYGDFTFDGIPDIAWIKNTQFELRVIISRIDNFNEGQYFEVCYPPAIHNKSLYPELMTKDCYYITLDNIRFCIVNGRRGIRVLTLGEVKECKDSFHSNSFGYSMWNINKGLSYSFFYWSQEEQRYVLDETVTREELENAWCPEDYFAYNGLQFSKLEGRLTDKDLKSLDNTQLRIMRNAVYARHGRPFQSVDLQSLWDCYSWYKKNPEYTDDLLTETDKYNICLIQKYEGKQ